MQSVYGAVGQVLLGRRRRGRGSSSTFAALAGIETERLRGVEWWIEHRAENSRRA